MEQTIPVSAGAGAGAEDRARIIRRASLVALLGNAALAAAKVAVGIASGSLAVVGDGIDTSVDVLIAGMTLFVSRVITLPADARHPWGYGRAETVATAGLSFILFFAGIQLLTSALRSMLSDSPHDVPAFPAVVVTLVSIAGKLLLALNQYRMGKKAASAMLTANAQNMAADVAISAAVLLGLGLSFYFKVGVIDTAAALAVSLWVLKAAVGIFLEANAELMDGGSPPEKYKAVFDAVRSVPGALNPHRARLRRIAGFWDINIDIEVDSRLTVDQAHRIATQVEAAIRQKLEAVYDIVIHIEPAGRRDSGESEGFGLTESSLGGAD
ncbi:MAG: cation diffusion facilitator family transporter [Spirochaetaceae bacterium]|jgi:cation diffusion facilitator family transporter|nr:cation diffusion facilitator family transporter [Spirochaetaceae bacterium]